MNGSLHYHSLEASVEGYHSHHGYQVERRTSPVLPTFLVCYYIHVNCIRTPQKHALIIVSITYIKNGAHYDCPEW